MSDYPKDDLFEETKMTFGEHLEELRVALFRSIIGIVIGFLIGLVISKYVVLFIQTPLQDALTEFKKDAAEAEIIQKYSYLPPDIQAHIRQGYIPQFVRVEPRSVLEAIKHADPDRFSDWTSVTDQFTADNFADADLSAFAKKLSKGGLGVKVGPSHAVWQRLGEPDKSFLDQLSTQTEVKTEDAEQFAAMLNRVANDETLHHDAGFENISIDESLRSDLEQRIKETKDASAARRLNSVLLASAFDEFVTPPELELIELPLWEKRGAVVQSLGPQEAFMIWLKAGFITGLILSSPWVFWQVWLFVAAGLYPHEKGYVYIYLPFSLILFLAGASLAFFFVFEPVLSFLFWYNQEMNIAPDMRISDWISFVLYVPLGFGLAFQLPLVMLFINRLGLIGIEFYLENWRIAILVIAFLSMILTPADPISMLLMAVPLTLLYFLGIALCKWMPKGRNPFAMEEVYEP